MPWLKPDEWESWSSENLCLQETQAEKNVNILLNRLWELWLDRNIHDIFKNRLGKWKVTPSAFMQKVTTKMIFELQRDLAALECFLAQWFWERLWEIDFDNPVLDIFTQVQTIMQNSTGPTDLQPVFPQMVLDAMQAVNTDWAHPPAQEMQDAQAYFADRAAASMNSTLT